MKRVKNFLNKLSKKNKMQIIAVLIVFTLLVSIAFPTFARFKNRSSIYEVSEWDGSVANSYRSGTGSKDDPYIISNGSELAYFAKMLKTTNYDGVYFALNHDIVLNQGVFEYDEANGPQYNLSNSRFYIKNYTNEFYDNTSRSGVKISNVNLFESLNNFKGTFDGNYYSIYGLYISDENVNDLGLFTNLEGTVTNLYVENALIYGGVRTGGIASNATNAKLSNVLFNGYVIGKKELVTNTLNNDVIIEEVVLSEPTLNKEVNLALPFISGNIKEVKLTGNLEITGDNGSVSINGNAVTNGPISMSLTDYTKLVIDYQSEGTTTFKFTDVKYEVSYESASAGGLIGETDRIELVNTINKGEVYGHLYSGGLVGSATNGVVITQSYNTGNVSSNYSASGLVGNINKGANPLSINKTYNIGILTAPNGGGLVGHLTNNSVLLTVRNSFSVGSNYLYDTLTNARLTNNKVYYTDGSVVKNGSTSGSASKTTIENLKDKTFLTGTLSFREFIDNVDMASNSANAWTFEVDGYPILFMDDLNNPLANLHVSIYTWNNVGYELNDIYLDSNIAFSIEEADTLRPLKEVYYYISKSKEPLLRSEIDAITEWNTYENIVSIEEEGFYVVYAKVVDYDENVAYLNSDLLVLDKSGSDVTISLNNKNWNSLTEDLNSVYVKETSDIKIEAVDDLSGVASVKYYVTNKSLTASEVSNLDESLWTNASNLSIDKEGTYVVYAKVVDNTNHITYVNTDYIVYGGYKVNGISLGRSDDYLSGPINITDKSSISMHVSYVDSNPYQSDYTHNLVSTILLPKNTKILLYDKKTNKIYSYKITTDEDLYNYNNSCDGMDSSCVKVATYPFTLFEELGKGTMENKYVEEVKSSVDENYKIMLDFSDTNITSDYKNVSLFIEIRNKDDEVVRSTLDNSIKKINIYNNVDALPYISSDYDGTIISYNSNSTTNINLKAGISYKTINNEIINDSSFLNKNIGIAIKLVDENGKTIEREYLKNMRFKVDGKDYSPDNAGVVRINFTSGLNEINKILTIETYQDNTKFVEGNYHFEIYSYAAYDGLHDDLNSSTYVNVPVSFSNQVVNENYSFNVFMDDQDKILKKNDSVYTLGLDAIQNGIFTSPNIRISLYKKSILTAYNQDYMIVNLKDYVTNNLIPIGGNVYYMFTNPLMYDGTMNTYNHFDLNLDMSKLESNGYKLVFELYDGNRRVGALEKKFIVK